RGNASMATDDPRHLPLYLISIDQIVCVDKLDEVAARSLISAVSRCPGASVLLLNQTDAGIAESLYFCDRTVVRAVIHNNHLDRGPGLPEDTLKSLAYIFLSIVTGYQDGNRRMAHGAFSQNKFTGASQPRWPSRKRGFNARISASRNLIAMRGDKPQSVLKTHPDGADDDPSSCMARPAA